MSIDARAKPEPTPSEERKVEGVATLYLNSAPPNGVGWVLLLDL